MDTIMDRLTCIAPARHQGKTRFNEIPAFREGLYDLGNSVYAWMVPNGSWGESNAGLITANGESLLIDTLWDVKYTRAMLEAMAPLLRESPITRVVNTHADGDHWWGNELVADAEIIASRAACDEMRHVRPLPMYLLGHLVGNLLNAAGIRRIGHWFQNMGAPYDFQEVTPVLPTRTFDKELALSIGGRTVRLIMVGPAHTLGDVIVHIADARVLFAADILFVDSTPVMWAGPVGSLIAALERILEIDADIIVPGHGPVTDKTGVRQVLAYWQYVDKEANRRYDDGMSARDAAVDIVLGDEFARLPFARWDSPERMMTNVNTIYRHRNGKTGPLTIPAMLNVLGKQALLAHRLPDARPAIMRKR